MMRYVWIFLSSIAMITLPCLFLFLIMDIDLVDAIGYGIFVGSLVGIGAVREARKPEALWKKYLREFEER